MEKSISGLDRPDKMRQNQVVRIRQVRLHSHAMGQTCPVGGCGPGDLPGGINIPSGASCPAGYTSVQGRCLSTTTGEEYVAPQETPSPDGGTQTGTAPSSPSSPPPSSGGASTPTQQPATGTSSGSTAPATGQQAAAPSDKKAGMPVENGTQETTKDASTEPVSRESQDFGANGIVPTTTSAEKSDLTPTLIGAAAVSLMAIGLSLLK